ncbi:MBL fold metallo-hydrolase [Rubrobacter marinus]|uniref:MBL fold metallo-hydrolase n=1 Tax=Rubrobacter marinus TaxID=2653852 RepID=A0A6G8Q2S8_9ACTN|nr:MBL fold metallo-hydrolase [Rubrobacter marinus]
MLHPRDEATGTGALVDPGDEAARIAIAVEGTNLEISQIIVTHAHIDHVGAIAPSRTSTPAPSSCTRRPRRCSRPSPSRR